MGWATVYKLSCCQAVTAHVGSFAVTSSIPHVSSSGLPLLPVFCVPPLHRYLVIRFSHHVFVLSIAVLLHQSPFASVLNPLSPVPVLTFCFTTKAVLFYFTGDGHRNCFSVYVKRQIALSFQYKMRVLLGFLQLPAFPLENAPYLSDSLNCIVILCLLTDVTVICGDSVFFPCNRCFFHFQRKYFDYT